MKVETQKVGPCRVKLIVNADAGETAPDHGKILSQYVSHGRIPGFRPGKAPREVIERRYQREIDDDLRHALVSKFHRLAIEQEKLAVAAIVDVADIVFSPSTGISFVLTIDLEPSFKLPRYDRIPLKTVRDIVDDAAVDQQLDSLRQSMSRTEDTEEPVASGDMVQVDYTATSGGKPLAEVCPESGNLAAATEFWIMAAEPELVPGMSAALLGAHKGETRPFSVKFPKDHSQKEMRGVKAEYQVTVKAVRKVVPPTAEEIVARLGLESEGKLREEIRASLERQAERREIEQKQQEIGDYLLKKCDFPLPQAVLDAARQRTLNRILNELGRHPDAKDYVAKNRDAILKNATEAATNQVRLDYILKAVAVAEKITVPEAEVNEQIAAAARQQVQAGQKDMTPAKLRETLEAGDGMAILRKDLLVARVMKWLLDDAKGAA